MVINAEEPIEQIKKLEQFIPEERQEELAQLLAYGEKIKAEGEIKKKEFWNKHNRDDFMKLLRYKWKNKKEIEGQYKYLDVIKGLERERFVEEYLHDDLFYSGELDEVEVEENWYDYSDLNKGNIEMKDGSILYLYDKGIGPELMKEIVGKLELKEGAKLDLSENNIGKEGAEAISNMELKEGVTLNLTNNGIGKEGAEVIAKNMELKEGVTLNLTNNGIGKEGAEAIAKNMKLKEGVSLNLTNNEIGNKGAEVIAKNMELKEGVTLNLSGNNIGNTGAQALIDNLNLKEGVILDLTYNGNISSEMEKNLKKWEKSYHDQGINCEVRVRGSIETAIMAKLGK